MCDDRYGSIFALSARSALDDALKLTHNFQISMDLMSNNHIHREWDAVEYQVYIRSVCRTLESTH